jgi:hypothetical protein
LNLNPKTRPNDPKIGCKFLSNLVDFIEFDVNLEEEFFRRTFRRV